MNSEWFFLKEAHSLSGLPNDDIPEYIFWGRSNVGKSSLINLLTKKNLAKTSKTPGRTKSLVFFQYKKIFRIVDFPGYGFSHIPKKKVIKLDNFIESYLTKRENIEKIFLLFDSRHLIKPIDKIIIESLLELQTNEINYLDISEHRPMLKLNPKNAPKGRIYLLKDAVLKPQYLQLSFV